MRPQALVSILALALLTLLATTGCTASLRGGGFVHGIGPPRIAPSVAHVDVRANVHVHFFGVPLAGAQDVVFVLDRSGSMDAPTSTVPSTTKLDVAKAELINTLRQLPDGTRFNVIFFDDSIAVASPHMILLGPATRAEAEAFISAIRPGDATAVVPALAVASQLGARRIVLLSDGLANSGGDGSDVLAHARAQMRFGVRFDTVGIGHDQDASLMQALAAESGGQAVMR